MRKRRSRRERVRRVEVSEMMCKNIVGTLDFPERFYYFF